MKVKINEGNFERHLRDLYPYYRDLEQEVKLPGGYTARVWSDRAISQESLNSIEEEKKAYTPAFYREVVPEQKLKKILPTRKRVAKLIETTNPLSFRDRILVIMSELKQLFCSHEFIKERRSFWCYSCKEVERCKKCNKIKMVGDL